jgi:hypothetical protein
LWLRAIELFWEITVGSYAVCVGINDYGGEDNLRGCVNDANNEKKFLLERSDLGFVEENIRICLDQKATARNIIDLLRWLFQNRLAEDRLLFTFSGHGSWTYPVGGSGWECCICCADCGINWDRGVITIAEFCREWASNCRNATIVLDSCFAGGMWAPGNPPLRELPAKVKEILFETDAEDRRKRGLRALPCPPEILARATRSVKKG